MAPRTTTIDDYSRRLLQAQLYIEQHLDEELNPAAIAKVASLSLHHFHRIFRAQLGESVMQRVRRLRLERAARELRERDGRVLDVAVRAGYESHEAFTRAFIERFEVAPSLFRAQPAARVREWVSGPERARLQVDLRELPAVPVAFLRHRGSYADVGQTWAKLVSMVGTQHLTALYGLCPDDPEVTAVEHLRFDACVGVQPGLRTEGLALGLVPAGRWAIALHVGPYERLHETYLDLIGRWAPRSGFELADEAVVEHYLNDPTRTPQNELRTEVRVRLA